MQTEILKIDYNDSKTSLIMNKIPVFAAMRDLVPVHCGPTNEKAGVTYLEHRVVSDSSQSRQARPESMHNCSRSASTISNAQEIT